VKLDDTLEKFIRYCANHGNLQICCDYVQLRLANSEAAVDFGGLNISSGSFSELRFIEKNTKRLHISQAYVDILQIEDANFSDVKISNCLVSRVEGIGSADKMPSVFVDCTFETFKGAFTISRISALSLTKAQKTLLAIIKKLFFQPGAGREEVALLRGAESYWDKDAADTVIRYMIREDIAFRTPGSQGDLIVPRRRHTVRMGKIWELQSNSGDDLWAIVT
jgi:hypothetical protein